MASRGLWGGLALVVVGTSATPAQIGVGGVGRYEALYGTPADVPLVDLLQSPAEYERRAVRTSGRLDFFPSAGREAYTLRDAFNNGLAIIPVSEVAGEFDSEVRRWIGLDVQVAGVFRTFSLPAASGSNVRYGIEFWEFFGPEQSPGKRPLEAKTVSLEALVMSPGRRDGQTVRVVGKFRGRNLYGDLPVRSQRRSADWVIKDDVYAVWVTGKKPKGSGWQLDPGLKRDTGKWIEVVGRPETRAGVTYLRALQVALATPPTPTAEAQAPPAPPERPKVPPVVVFALPLDGEGSVPRDSRFVVQFSKDMNESTFKGHVLLRYAGPRLPGDREFDGMKLSYDGGRRALTVDPGDLLRSGRQVEILLLPGIADVDGLDLAPRAGGPIEGAVDVLRYQVGL